MFRSIAPLVLIVLGCSRTPPESLRRDVAPDVAHASASQSSRVNVHTAAQTPTAAQVDTVPHAEVAAVATSATTPAEAPLPSGAAERPFRFAGAKRIVAIGDLHGDLASAREALSLAGAIDADDHWAGGELVLVQVGDQLDRGDDEPEILRLLDQLAEEAPKKGGAVHILNGNHELMNAAGDLRYVTEDGLRDYAASTVPTTARFPASFPAEARGRFAAFAPGSQLARKLAARNTIAIIGETVFVHAGVLPQHVRYGVGRINDEVSRFLRGETPTLPEVAASEDAPVWTRVYGAPNPSAEACRELESVLAALAVKRMVVGHTPQQSGVNAACDGRVYRVDVGLSDYYGRNATQVLELTAGGAKVLTANTVGGSR